jgi:hypothetical protein
VRERERERERGKWEDGEEKGGERHRGIERTEMDKKSAEKFVTNKHGTQILYPCFFFLFFFFS